MKARWPPSTASKPTSEELASIATSAGSTAICFSARHGRGDPGSRVRGDAQGRHGRSSARRACPSPARPRLRRCAIPTRRLSIHSSTWPASPRAIRKAGGRFYAETTVEEVEEDENGVKITTAAGHVVSARHAVVATNSPINDRYAIHTKQAPYRTYAMAFSVPKGALPDGLYWDTLEAYHYVRLQPGRGQERYPDRRRRRS